MVCTRCIKVVADDCIKLGLKPTRVDLGVVEFQRVLSTSKMKQLSDILRQDGFEVLPDKRGWIIEQVKHIVIDLVRHPEKLHKNYSTYLAKSTGLEYHYLSGLFSATENITIEQFMILQKIERAKELIIYDELTLKEIARTMGYSSSAHFSSQFKKVTGLSPSYFKSLRSAKRIVIDALRAP